MGRNFKLGAGRNFTNGEVRMRVYEGSARGVYKWVFAGNTHEHFTEGTLKDMASMRLGNFDSFIQATRGRKYERFRKVRNSLRERENKNEDEIRGV
jgi:hypothetical protein